MFILNKNIVHLVDDILWNCGFKTEKQGNQVIILIILIIVIIVIIVIMFMFVSIWVLQTTFGQTNKLILPKN
jgi:hypothetical protein